MKKIIPLIALIMIFPILSLSLCSCDMGFIGFGSLYVTDPEEYGSWEDYLDIPNFLPPSLDGLTVNGYSYTIHSYMDTCFEIFLDITVSVEQLQLIIANAKDSRGFLCEKGAYYAEGYRELVFEDHYEIFRGEDDKERNVGWADIEKIVYNPEALNVVYTVFHANDTGVYPLDEVAYFGRFGILEDEYVASIG